MDGVAEWLLQGGDLRAQPGGVPPAVLRGQQHVAGKGPIAIDTEHPRVFTEVVEATPALAAGVVDDMGLSGHEGPGREVFDVRPGGHDAPRHLVTEYPRRKDVALGPFIPVEDVDVGAADGGSGDLDQDVRALRLRDLDLVDLGARTGSGFDHCRHGRHGFHLSGGQTRILRWKFDQEGVMRAYVLINASAGKAIEVAKSLQGVKGIELADAITGEYDVIAAVEAPDVAGIGSVIVEKIQKIDGVFKTVTCLAVR